MFCSRLYLGFDILLNQHMAQITLYCDQQKSHTTQSFMH